MTSSRKNRQRSGASIGDMLVFLSILTLGFALVYPQLQQRAFEQQLQGAVSAVETLRAASSAFMNRTLEWPAPSPAGVAPSELASVLPPEFSLPRDGYTLAWNRWEIVDRTGVAVPPETAQLSQGDLPRDSVLTRTEIAFRTRGGLTIYSGNSALLAGLLGHFGTRLSFVRDTTWTLVVPR